METVGSTKMSIKVMTWVFDHSRSKKNARLVLLGIADCAHDDGRNAYPSVAELMRKSGLSERGVQGALKTLTELGELHIEINGGPRGCNLYRVLMDKEPPQELPPAESAGEAQNLRDELSNGEVIDPVSDPADSAPRNSCPPQKTTETPADSAPGTVREPSKSSSTKNSSRRRKPATTKRAQPKPPPDRPDVERICTHLADRVEANGSLRPTITAKWRDSARLLLDQDGRTEEQVMKAIDWCQHDEFWRANVKSMPTLRKQYDTLRLHAKRPNGTAPRRQLVEHNGMLLKPETVADLERRKRFEAMDATNTQLAIGGTA